MRIHGIERADDERINWPASVPFLAAHILCFAAVFTGVDRRALVMFGVLYVSRMFFITAGYHRYFAHRSYKLGRAMQFLMAFGGSSASQKSALWWAGHHRNHHRFSDTELDLHSPQKGFWWSHVGWILCNKNKGYDPETIRDFHKFPELRFLHNHDWIAPWTLGVASFLIGGWSGLVVGFLWSTVLLWHATFTVNSLAHVMGRRRYATEDTSRNSALIALLTLGEGWHNNHHHYQASARQGFFWWEVDVSYYGLKALSWVGLVRDLKAPPEKVLNSSRISDGSFDMGMFRAHWGKANAALTAARRTGVPVRELVSTAVAAGAADDDGRSSDRQDLIAGDRASRRDQLEGLIHERRATLEEYVGHSLRSAEELAKLSRRQQRAAVNPAD